MTEKCKCPALEELFQLRARAEDLEGRCELIGSSVELESFLERQVPAEEISMAITYSVEAERFQKAVREYRTEVGRLFSSGELKKQNKDSRLYCSGCDIYVDEISK
jgi:hypothetical protein